MRKHVVLISMLILWASVASGAMSEGPVGLDILGSKVNNTTIVSLDDQPIEVDIIGSTASNILIGNQRDEVNKGCHSECAPCGEKKVYTTPWDDFKRPLCYPWSSYIPTRYNKQFINMNPKPASIDMNPRHTNVTSSVITLGRGSKNS